MDLPLLLSEITRLQARRVADEALVVLPTGATEQHGPHLPVGTDSMAVEFVARRAAELLRPRIPALVAPTLAFGSSPHHLPFGGTMSVSTETYYRLICDLLESLAQGGFRRIFIVNGHGGNSELIQLAARDVALRRDIAVAAGSYWTIAWQQLTAAGAGQVGHLPGHAGAFETSLVLALRPELVHEPRPARDLDPATSPPMPADPYRSEIHGFWQRIDGYSDSPAPATRPPVSAF
ncbi:MAG: creatininase family protein [Oscillochloris sp.]|nr:creatininase family protein [Oscillochloris sp.]